MPSFKVIDASEAPPVRTRQSQFATDLLAHVGSLEEGQVLRVTPEQGKSLRGLQAGIGRVLKAAAIQVKTWDDGEHAYIARKPS